MMSVSTASPAWRVNVDLGTLALWVVRSVLTTVT